MDITLIEHSLTNNPISVPSMITEPLKYHMYTFWYLTIYYLHLHSHGQEGKYNRNFWKIKIQNVFSECKKLI